MLSMKHTGGVAGEGKTASGFDHIDQLIQVPKPFKGGAAHSEADGAVTRDTPAPAGGKYVYVDGQEHFVPADAKLKVQQGDRVEASEVLSEGIPNPAKIVEHQRIGEGRRYLADVFRNAMRRAGIGANRRNAELLARRLI